jgi:SAM-dependent methyltransferase
LRCNSCGAEHPIRRGIAILLEATDRAASLARAAEPLPDWPAIRLGDLTERSLGLTGWLRVAQRSAREAVRAARGRRGRPHSRKDQTSVKRKYEQPKYNYYRMNEREIPLLLGSGVRRASGWLYKRELARTLLEAARGVGARRVVEVGCGDGTNFWALDHFFPDHGLELLGFDYSFSRTALAAHHLQPRHQLWNGDAKRIALPDRCADLVVTVHCLEHMPYDNSRALREIARLAPYVLLLEPFLEHQSALGRWHNEASDYARDLRENAIAAGIEIAEFRRLRLGSPFNQTGLLLGKSRL